MSSDFAILAAVALPLAGGAGIVLTRAWPNLRETVSLATAVALAVVAWSLLPAVMPTTAAKVYGVLGYTPAGAWREQLAWGATLTGAKVAETAILFPRPQSPEAGAAKG